jgi:hypothetical protein
LADQNLCDVFGDRLTDLIRRFFLQEVGSLDGDLLLVGPGAAEFPLGADQEAAGSASMNSLGIGLVEKKQA